MCWVLVLGAGAGNDFPLEFTQFSWPGNGLFAGLMEKSTEIDGVIVEFHQIGNAVKVSAIDTKTFLEVSITAPANCTKQEMIDTALRKLAYVQEKGTGRHRTRVKR